MDDLSVRLQLQEPLMLPTHKAKSRFRKLIKEKAQLSQASKNIILKEFAKEFELFQYSTDFKPSII